MIFTLFQIVQFGRISGIVSGIDGRFVTIMWEDGTTNGVEFRRASAIQWSKVLFRRRA